APESGRRSRRIRPSAGGADRAGAALRHGEIVMIKGAFIELIPAINLAVPNVIVFQFNPETLRHSWSQSTTAGAQPGQLGSNPLAVSGVPSETFSLSLSLDVTDQLADPAPQVVE